jgi:hypothetical protein
MYLPTASPRLRLKKLSSHRATHNEGLEWVMWCMRSPALLRMMRTAARLRRTAAVASWQQRRRGLREATRACCRAGCRSFSSHTPPRRRLSDPLSRIICLLPVGELNDTSRQCVPVVGPPTMLNRRRTARSRCGSQLATADCRTCPHRQQ